MGFVVNWLSKIRSDLRRFLTEDDGTAGLEFVCASPLLLGVLVFTAEYGQAMRARLVLDSAVQDAARYLSRAPVNRGADDANGNPTIVFYTKFVNEANAAFFRRMNDGDTTTGGLNIQVRTVDATNFREPYYVIDVAGTVTINMPLLSLINIFSRSSKDGRLVEEEIYVDAPNPLSLSMTATRSVRWSNGSVPGEASCILADRYRGLCP